MIPLDIEQLQNVPYYHKLFDDLKLSPDDIKKVEDLKKLPILTKETIKHNWEDFKHANLNKLKYYEAATGGSTGTPFKYRLYKFDRFLGGAMLYKGWGYGGFELGDKMVFLAGASLDIGKKSYVAKREKLLEDKIDVTAFMVWFIENYPKSVIKMKENLGIQYKFR